MKKIILGLDLGTNSVGWALVNKEEGKILGMGSRIIPMGVDKLDYEKGAGITKNADRRTSRTIRKMNKRFKLRRNKLLYILNELEMLPDQFQFKNGIPESSKLQSLELLPIKKGTLQLDSLNHYKLRVSALTEQIELKDFGKILYQFNQLRGYSGGDREDTSKSNEEEIGDEEGELKKKNYEVITQKVEILKVEKSDDTFKSKTGQSKGEELFYYDVTIILDDEEREGRTMLQNLEAGKEEELEIRIKRTKKDENVIFALPKKTNWRKQMEATEELIESKKWHTSELLLNDLINNKWTKVRNRVVLRHRYKDEFDAVWKEQAKHHAMLNNCPENKLRDIADYLYPGPSESQQKLRNDAIQGGLKHIIKEHVIYYQRPLKPQTDLIGKCQFEKDQQVIANSHPLYQEFRCWDQINKLHVTLKEESYNDRKARYVYKYKDRYLTTDQKTEIYLKLQNQKQVGYNEIAKIAGLKSDNSEFLNGLNVKAKLKGCDTSISIKKVLQDRYNEIAGNDPEIIFRIWDVLFNKTGNEYDINSEKVSALISLLEKYIDQKSATELALKMSKEIYFPRKYGSLSETAILRILPLMQCKSIVDEFIHEKIAKIRHTIETGEIVETDNIEVYMIDYIHNNPNVLETGGMMYAFASSLIYGKHTADKIKPTITNYHDIKHDPDRNLRNPVVQQITNEALQILKAVWKQYKLNPEELEIRIELARDLKNSAAEREKIYKGQITGQKINSDIKKDLINEGILATNENILKYKLCKQQKFQSPYSGNILTPGQFDEYEIDHIIPKSRLFDDSTANKVLVESYLNKEKGNRTAWEYMQQQTTKYKIQSLEGYLHDINNNYYGKKKKNLLLEKIPINFIERQIKETQFMSVAVKNELAKIVGSDNVKTTTGEITSFLRSRWGLKKLLMRLTESRFKQMELWDWDKEKDQPNNKWVKKHFDEERKRHVYEIKHWSKRYDHRHHAIDALVVALTEQSHIQRLNNLNKELQDWLNAHKEEIQLEVQEDETILEAFFNLDEKRREEIQKRIEGFRKFDQPFDDLCRQAEHHLETILISHKPKDKLSVQINDKTGKKELKIRAALHEATLYGKLTSGQDTKSVAISGLTAKDVDKIIDPVLTLEIRKHWKKYTSMKEAFTGEGLKEFNETRFQTKKPELLKPPVYKVKIRYNTKEDAKSSLQRLYANNEKLSVKTGDNYLFIVMEKEGKKGKERVFDIASLYDSADIAKRALREKDENFKKKICEDFRIKHKEKPDKVLFTLQQYDLVYLPVNVDDPVLKFSSKAEFDLWYSIKENKINFGKRVYKAVKFTDKYCFFIPHNYANTISVPKDLTTIEQEALKKEYGEKKIPRQRLNFEEFGSFGTSAKTEVNEYFVKELVSSKKDYDGILPSKIQQSCIKIKTDWIGNVKLEYL